jgi:hypothetical protein
LTFVTRVTNGSDIELCWGIDRGGWGARGWEGLGFRV